LARGWSTEQESLLLIVVGLFFVWKLFGVWRYVFGTLIRLAAFGGLLERGAFLKKLLG